MSRNCGSAIFRIILALKISDHKRKLRKIALKAREEAFDGKIVFSSLQIAGIKKALANSKIVAGYIAMGSEINPEPIMQSLSISGIKLGLPRVNSQTNALDFHEYNFDDELLKNDFGIREPYSTAPLLTPDALIVPLLAFDIMGFRLGYGGGYYDKAIANLHQNSDLITIGIGFEEQLFDNLPTEPHDMALDFVVTPQKLYDFRKN